MMNEHATEADLVKLHGDPPPPFLLPPAPSSFTQAKRKGKIDSATTGLMAPPCGLTQTLLLLLLLLVMPPAARCAELADAVQENMENFRPSDIIVLNIGNDHR